MNNIFKRNVKALGIGVALVLIGSFLFSTPSAKADVTSNYWIQNAPGSLATNTPGGLAHGDIHVAHCYIGIGNGTPCSGGTSGTVTSITAGTGLTASPNPIIATGTISLDSSYVPYTAIVAPTGGNYNTLRAAVTAVCGAGGGSIYVKDGTYTETATIVGCTSLRITLSQGAIEQFNGAVVTTAFNAASGSARIIIEGGKWLQTQATAQGTAFDMSNLSNTYIQNTRVEGFGIAALYNDTTSTTFYNSINNAQFFDDNNCVEYIGTQANSNSIDNLRCRQKAGGAGTGLVLVAARGITVKDSDFEPATATGITGISIDATSREIELLNNWIENNATGVSIASGANRIKFDINSITGNTTDISNSAAAGAVVFNSTSRTGTTISNGVMSVPTGGNLVGLSVTQNDTTNNPNAISVTNAGTGNSISVIPTGNTGTSASTSGALFLNNTSNTGIGANFYTNSSTFGTAGLIFAKSDNSSSTGPVARFDQDGTGPGIKINQNGNTGTTTGSSGGLMVVQNGTGFGAQFYSGVGAGNGALVHIEADNVLWDQPLLEINTAGTDGGAANIKLGGPAPQIEMVESDQVSPAGKFEIGTNGDQFYIAGRNSGNTSFERMMEFNRLASGGGFNLYGATSGSTGVISTAVASGVLTLPAATDTLVARATTDTLTNKRITPRIASTASSATPTPNGDTTDQYEVTALAAGATFGAPTGTPTDGQLLTIRIKDNATPQTLAWNAIYRASSDLALPTTTVTSKTMYLKFIYNSADSKWDFVAYLNNF